MTDQIKNLKETLQAKNIRLSHQRLKVLEYLAQNKTHPSADEIYSALQKDLPSLSRATVYNTLHMLQEAGLVNVVSIEDSENRYEILTESHGHFQCTSCKKIFDFSLNMKEIESTDLADFEIKERDVYFRGLCPDCCEAGRKTSHK
ncbi:MAG: transcriptional repressor [Clostridiaceae bacterium]|jgi:Fe2+ or Zn2+ uptake regulation protein|nr:transcriptional repressor [Clostridiaceae bacterium]